MPIEREIILKCPVCNAGFRGQEVCPRCGTNLLALMRLAARAWALRQKARADLHERRLADALRASAQARRLQRVGRS